MCSLSIFVKGGKHIGRSDKNSIARFKFCDHMIIVCLLYSSPLPVCSKKRLAEYPYFELYLFILSHVCFRQLGNFYSENESAPKFQYKCYISFIFLGILMSYRAVVLLLKFYEMICGWKLFSILIKDSIFSMILYCFWIIILEVGKFSI